uniref:Abhydrolase domain containing 4, N-acyl phospholipase B n=1 Tax=Hucho hucho TaxID=62062 RepID=A0A4W5R0U1_9TELE
MSRETLSGCRWWPSWHPPLCPLNISSLPVAHTPLVMVHGFGGGVGLCRSRRVFVFDLLGFRQHWRLALALDRMILLGHSLGGYLTTSYAIQYPRGQRRNLQLTHSLVANSWCYDEEHIMYEGGLISPRLVNRFRLDFNRKFDDRFNDDTMTQYLYHCNAQTLSGEVGPCQSRGWAKRPMLYRVHLLPPSLPVILVYGGGSWMDTEPHTTSIPSLFLSLSLMVEGAAHDVYADQPEEFNRVVQSICDTVDKKVCVFD